MFHFFLTIITEILTSFDFSRPLCFLSILIVVMLLSSPGAIGTIIGAGAKLGIFLHIKEEKEKAAA